MDTLRQKQWSSFPDDSMAELPQDVYFRSYVLEANNHVPPHSHAFTQFHFARKGSMRIDVAGKCWIIPAHYGIWIPNNIEHAVWALDDVYLENLDIKRAFLRSASTSVKWWRSVISPESLFITPPTSFQAIMIASQKKENW